MKFIVIVIGILLLQRMGSLSRLQQDGWYRSWVTRLSEAKWLKAKDGVRLLLSLLVPVFLLVVLLLLLDDHWFGIPVLVLSFLVFLYSLGRGNLDEQVEDYRDDLVRDDLQAAYHDAAEFNPAGEVGAAENWDQLHQESVGAISYRYFERYYAVMFWFVLAGAPGALLYRLLVLHQDMALDNEVDKLRIQHWLKMMEWLPARLTGLALAFVGHFTACLDYWRGSLWESRISTAEVMAGYVSAALQLGSNPSANTVERETEVADIHAIFSRVLIFSLCVVAFLVMLL